MAEIEAMELTDEQEALLAIVKPLANDGVLSVQDVREKANEVLMALFTLGVPGAGIPEKLANLVSGDAIAVVDGVEKSALSPELAAIFAYIKEGVELPAEMKSKILGKKRPAPGMMGNLTPLEYAIKVFLNANVEDSSLKNMLLKKLRENENKKKRQKKSREYLELIEGYLGGCEGFYTRESFYDDYTRINAYIRYHPNGNKTGKFDEVLRDFLKKHERLDLLDRLDFVHYANS